MIQVDLRSRKSLYEQLIDNIRETVICGGLAPDEQLPSVRALAAELGINPNTIQKAYNELERQGIIYSLKGRGSFVSPDTAALGEAELKRFEDEITELLVRAKEHGMTKARAANCISMIWGNENDNS